MTRAPRLGQPLGSPSNGYGAARSWVGTLSLLPPLPPLAHLPETCPWDYTLCFLTPSLDN